MYPRWLYVALLGAGVAALEFAAAFGGTWQSYAAYATALALGGVVFYQGEARVTDGPVFANAVVALFVGTAVSLLVAAGLLTAVLGAPFDLALWQAGITMFDAWLGVAFALVTTFFLVGLASAYA